MITCQELDAVKYLVLVSSVFEEIVALEVLVVISEDDLVFEVNEIRGEKMIVDDFIGDFAEEEVELGVILLIESSVDWLARGERYFWRHPRAIASSIVIYNLNHHELYWELKEQQKVEMTVLAILKEIGTSMKD